MSHSDFLKDIKTVEKIASVSKFRRMLTNPFRYFNAILFRKFVYSKTKKEKEIQCKTFFGVDMNVLLPSSTDIYLTGGKSHETEIRLAKFLIQNLKANDTFLDVGAHYGYFSLLASKLVGEKGNVFSFEPSPTTFNILNKNQLPHANIKVNNLAVSDVNSTLTFYEFPNLYSEYNTLDVSQFENEPWFEEYRPKEITIDAIVLDDFLKKENIQFKVVKIDVEGAEFQVIGGMEKYLEKHSPVIIMEYLSDVRGNEEHIKAEQFLYNLGFEPYLIDDSGKLQSVSSVVGHLRNEGLESDNIAFVKVSD
jgi:FkbM family methyltransferase